MSEITVQQDGRLTAQEVVKLRTDSGWEGDSDEWEKCLTQNMINVSARTPDGELVGVGFISRTVRHAEVVDMVVLPAFRQHGIGARILDYLCEYAQANNIRYFGLTYDKNPPWLKNFYEKHGFELIDFAMWHKNSLS